MPPNILLVVLDSARARNCSLHDYYRETTPTLDKINATIYTQARAPSNWSLPSHTSIFTGIPSPSHKLHGRNYRLEPGHTIWEDIKNEGYMTGVFSDNIFITREVFGLSTGFDTVKTGFQRRSPPFPSARSPMDIQSDGVREYLIECLNGPQPIRSIGNGVGTKTRHLTWVPDILKDQPANMAAETVSSFLDWSSNCSRPWAACLNFIDTHHPYHPVPDCNLWGEDPYAIYDDLEDGRWEYIKGQKDWSGISQLVDLYDGTIRQADAAIQSVVSSLKKRGEYDETLIIVTSDHGDCFGESSPIRESRLVAHAGGLLDELTHVPLVVKYPAQHSRKINNKLVGLHSLYDLIEATAEERTDSARSWAQSSRYVTLAADHDQRYSAADHNAPACYVNKLRNTEYVVFDTVEQTKYMWWGSDEGAFEDYTDRSYTGGSVPDQMKDIINTQQEIDIVEEGQSESSSTKEALEALGYL